MGSTEARVKLNYGPQIESHSLRRRRRGLDAGVEAVPHHPVPSECLKVGMNLCSAEDDFIETRHEHVPHSEYNPTMPSGYRWIASGQVHSTSTGPSHFLPAGERLFPW